MIITRELGTRGQVVIPKDIRDMLGLRPGKKVQFEIENNEVKIKRENSEKFLEELFNDSPRLKKGLRIKDIKKDRDEQYDIP